MGGDDQKILPGFLIAYYFLGPVYLNGIQHQMSSTGLIENLPTLAVGAVLLSILLVLVFRLRQERLARLRVEASTAEQRARLNAIFNNAGVGVFLADRKLCLVDVNQRWCRMLSRRRKDVRGCFKIREMVHPDHVGNLDRHFMALLEGRARSGTVECRFLRSDGNEFWGVVATSTVKERDGKPLWVVGMITDVDEKKRIEQALRDSEERLRFITENTHDVVWQLDSELRFTYINGADERMRGYAREEVIGQHFKELICPQGWSSFENAMQEQQGFGSEAGRVTVFDVEMCCKSGKPLWVEVSATAVHDLCGKITGYIGVTRDATRKRASQEALKEQTIRDPLTGLYNRRYLDESIEREISRAGRDNTPLSVLMIDIDHFKALNDSYGHRAGDEVIRGFGELIRSGARNGDLPCRYGGEEFLILLPNMPLEAAVERAEFWRQAFSDQLITTDSGDISATLSAGVACFSVHGTTSQMLVDAADQALYSAKHGGRDRVVVASSTTLIRAGQAEKVT